MQIFDRIFKKKEITAYPTYAYHDKTDENFWIAPMRAWVHKRRDLFIDEAIVRLFERKIGGRLEDAERETVKHRFADFIADDDYYEEVEFQIEGDRTVYTFAEKTDVNGLVEEKFRLPAGTVERLKDDGGWLTYTARSDGIEARGRIRALEPKGLSVVSDIDDTIKITEVPAGDETVLRRTFIMDYETASVRQKEATVQMHDKYREIAAEYPGYDNLSFHYVSGSPWQMYRLLDEFLIRGRNAFPEGTFHMKSLRKNLTDPDSWEDLFNLSKGKQATLIQKIGQITELMTSLPERDFILIGDSGEMDPEVFLAMHKMFPARVKKIIIRDVLGGRLKHELIEVLEADTVHYKTIKMIKEIIKEKKLDIKLEDEGI